MKEVQRSPKQLGGRDDPKHKAKTTHHPMQWDRLPHRHHDLKVMLAPAGTNLAGRAAHRPMLHWGARLHGNSRKKLLWRRSSDKVCPDMSASRRR
jgi:hypothetical protein